MGFLALLPALLGAVGPILAKVLPDEGERLQVQRALIEQQADLGRAMAEVMKGSLRPTATPRRGLILHRSAVTFSVDPLVLKTRVADLGSPPDPPVRAFLVRPYAFISASIVAPSVRKNALIFGLRTRRAQCLAISLMNRFFGFLRRSAKYVCASASVSIVKR
ncbi:hypothetical protein ACRBEV_18220 [Methylobacterium phyllosphaerae]